MRITGLRDLIWREEAQECWAQLLRVKQTSSIDLAVELMRLFLLLSWKHGCGAVLSALHQTQHLYQDF